MLEWVKSKLNLRVDSSDDEEYERCVRNIIMNEKVQSMKKFLQHGDTNCLEHSIYVSYSSYILCRWLGFDYSSAARGGLLHDFFLYDWHTGKPYKGLHGFIHPDIALQNAQRYFHLNEREKDIIKKHMWPLTIRLPRYKESYIVLLVDKYCALMEAMEFGSRKNVYRLKALFKI